MLFCSGYTLFVFLRHFCLFRRFVLFIFMILLIFVFVILCVCLDIVSFVFFFKDTATTEFYTYGHPLSLHDALPFSNRSCGPGRATTRSWQQSGNRVGTRILASAGAGSVTGLRYNRRPRIADRAIAMSEPTWMYENFEPAGSAIGYRV